MDPSWKERHKVKLDSIGHDHNVNIRFEDVARALQYNITPRLMDFLEIASYVFTADCSTVRGKWSDDTKEEPWTRDLAFIIAVREPEFWASSQVITLLREVLQFLSNDVYSFRFVPLDVDRPKTTPYFGFPDREDWPFHRPHRVLMFSGGLDSLAGIVETGASGGKAVLVSHRPVSTLDSRQKNLFAELQTKFPEQFLHVPVWINKNENFSKEPTQRTRSFLFAALGTLVAQSIEAEGIRFYENGVLSVNLPMAEEALRARASRTTHPKSLHLLSQLAAAVTERAFSIDNPFLFKTKSEVVKLLASHDAAHLISLTCSCSHLMFQSKEQRHCGMCSQCIDRRFAMADAELISRDPQSDYMSDVFTGPRTKELDRSIAVDYTRHGVDLADKSDREIAGLFNTEISRAVFYETNRRDAADALISMYQRHGNTVKRVLEEQVRQNATKLIERTLEKTSLLALLVGQQFLPSAKILVDEPESRRNTQIRQRTGDQHLVLMKLDQVIEKLDSSGLIHNKTPKKVAQQKALKKRDTILFAAIVSGLEGLKYCIYLDKHRVMPKWSNDGGPRTYHESYLVKNLRKKIQDEKSRAKHRMDRYAESVLMNAFISYLQPEFDSLREFANSRNSLRASKKLKIFTTA